MESAFFDTSAIVPLCFQEPSTEVCRRLYAEFAVTVWWTTIIECRSALSRLIRTGQLKEGLLKTAVQSLSALSAEWMEVLPSRRIRDGAVELLGKHPLRAADALQLAAALEWRRNARGRVFVSGDERLLSAAGREGLETRLTTKWL